MIYRPEVDGLRAVAVVPVVLYHAGLPGFSGGFAGVDVFFVISGYLITGLLCTELDKTGRVSVAGFLERRVRRLGPSFLLVLAATLALGFAFLSPIGGEQQGLARSALAAVALSANVYFMAFTGGYFDAPAEAQPLLHLWSLAVEEQFYLVWPWLLWGAYAVAKRRAGPSGGRSAQLPLFLGVLVTSFVACVLLTPVGNGAAFYLAPTRAWEFALGALAFWWLTHRPAMSLPMSRSLSVVGLMLIAGSYVALDRSMNFPGHVALWPVLGATLVLIGTAADREGPVARLLKLRVMVWVGLISYPLYLWHWPLLVVARTNSLEPTLPAVQSVLLVTLAVVLAWATWRFVEQPIRQRQWNWARQPRQLAFSAAKGLAVVVCMTVSMGVWSKWLWPNQQSNAALASAVNGLQKVRVPCGQATPYTGVLVAQEGCSPATVGSTAAERNGKALLVWGDSHAAHLVPALSRLAERQSQTLHIRYMPECPPLIGFSPASVGITRPKGCERFNADVMAEIQALQRQGQLAGVYLNARWAGYTRFGNDLGGASAGLSASLQALQGAGVPAHVVAPGPEFPAEVPRCVVRRPAESCDLPRPQAEERRSKTLKMLAARAAEFNAGLVDPFEALCSEAVCPVIVDGQLMYTDSHHWSVPGSLAVFTALTKTRTPT